MADRQNYFQSYKGAEEGILLVRVNSGRWSQVEPEAVDSKSGCFALITHYLPPCKQHSYLSLLLPASNSHTQGDSPKIRTNTFKSHPILRLSCLSLFLVLCSHGFQHLNQGLPGEKIYFFSSDSPPTDLMS